MVQPQRQARRRQDRHHLLRGPHIGRGDLVQERRARLALGEIELDAPERPVQVLVRDHPQLGRTHPHDREFGQLGAGNRQAGR